MLVEAVLRQAELDLDLSVERDVATMQRRCEHEGLPFLTITLPLLSDALERGLESGLFSCPSSFARHGRLPRFLGGFFKRVFAQNGELRDDADPDVIFYIRQVCRFFKKLKKECLPKYNNAAVQHFLDVEAELRVMTPQIERKDDVLDKISALVWSQVFPEIDGADLVCHHGPGFTADRLSSNGRWQIRKWNQRSEYLFPSDLHCYPNYEVAARVSGIGKSIDCVEGPEFLDLREEMPVRIVFVPKTQTTPRVIAMEPHHMQYMQQSVKDYVYKVLEGHDLTRRSIRFADQTANQKLAHSGSIDKRTATLDLKDASDRVHLHLVQRIFKNSGLLEYLEDARSLHATLPNGKDIVLFKYASMGSALCFPVEAMVFYTLVLSAMHQLDGKRPSSRSVKNYSRQIAIYGDDIIVPVEYTDVVVRYLESYALKVNVNKSFSKGFFRESCGADYYKGVSVKPIYARMEPLDNVRDWTAEHVMSWNATADLFYLRGMWIAAQAVRDLLSRVVRRTIPKTRVIGPGIASFSFVFTTDLRYDRDLQCWKQKRLVYQPTKKKDDIDGNELACLNFWGISQTLKSRARARINLPGYTAGSGYSSNLLESPIQRLLREDRGSGDQLGKPPLQEIVWDGSPIGPQEHDNSSVRRDEGSFATSENHEAEGTKVPSARDFLDAGNGVSPSNDRELTRYEGWNFSADYCLTEEVQSDPLAFLDGRVDGIDFLSSTKRGCFKSKSRWVSLAS